MWAQSQGPKCPSPELALTKCLLIFSPPLSVCGAAVMVSSECKGCRVSVGVSTAEVSREAARTHHVLSLEKQGSGNTQLVHQLRIRRQGSSARSS